MESLSRLARLCHWQPLGQATGPGGLKRELSERTKTLKCLCARARPAGMAMLWNPPAPLRGVLLNVPAGPPHAGTLIFKPFSPYNGSSGLIPCPTHPCSPQGGLPSDAGGRFAALSAPGADAGLLRYTRAIHFWAASFVGSIQSDVGGPGSFCGPRRGPLGRSHHRPSGLLFACVGRASGLRNVQIRCGYSVRNLITFSV